MRPPIDEAEVRAAAASLLAFQARTRAQELPRLSQADGLLQLAPFAQWCAAQASGGTFSAAQQAQWDRVSHALADSAAAQPAVALCGGAWPGAEWVEPAAGAVSAGPITYDLAHLLRHAHAALPEEVEIDIAVRWWQGARSAGLPVDADFGEVWRALEWMSVQQALVMQAAASELAPQLANAARVALRYAPLKPLLRLLPPVTGAEVSAGFTF